MCLARSALSWRSLCLFFRIVSATLRDCPSTRGRSWPRAPPISWRCSTAFVISVETEKETRKETAATTRRRHQGSHECSLGGGGARCSKRLNRRQQETATETMAVSLWGRSYREGERERGDREGTRETACGGTTAAMLVKWGPQDAQGYWGPFRRQGEGGPPRARLWAAATWGPLCCCCCCCCCAEV